MREQNYWWYVAMGAAMGATVAAGTAAIVARLQDRGRLPGGATLPKLPSPADDVFVLAPEWGVIRTEHVLPLQHALERSPESIGLVIHTLGGTILAVDHIAHMLRHVQGKVTVYVPYMALSGGTMIALAADEIVMEPSAILGPVDPQIDGWPAVGILEVVERKPPESVDDEWVLLAAESRKALKETRDTVRALVDSEAAVERLTSGATTHARPITYGEAHTLGLPVRLGVPPELVLAVDNLVSQAPKWGCFPPIMISAEHGAGVSRTRLASLRASTS